MGEDSDWGKLGALEKLNRLYLAIISRYRDYIEEHENISLAELPALVTPKNGAVVAKVDEIKSSFERYDYEKNFREAGTAAFEFVRGKVDDIVLPLQFWLAPEETLAFMIGDTLDRCTLLCSMLIALGNPSSKVAVVMKGDSRRIFVHCELDGSVYMFDLGDGIRRFAAKRELIASLNIDKDTTAYEFNDITQTDIG